MRRTPCLPWAAWASIWPFKMRWRPPIFSRRSSKPAHLQDEDLDSVRQRRLFPVKVIQGFQVAVHNRVLKPAISGGERIDGTPAGETAESLCGAAALAGSDTGPRRTSRTRSVARPLGLRSRRPFCSLPSIAIPKACGKCVPPKYREPPSAQCMNMRKHEKRNICRRDAAAANQHEHACG